MSAAATKEETVELPPMTEDQKVARLEIAKAFGPKRRHLLEGGAGVGKTWLSALVIKDILERGKTVVATAPTHAAVAVLAEKLKAAGISVPVRTTHALLSLEPRPDERGRLRLKRRKHAKPVEYDAVAIDETSMVGSDLDGWVERLLFHCFVLHIGDDHQIPPVGEAISPTFKIRSRSLLREPVRQEKDNPLLQIANEVRALQERPDMDWSWIRSIKAKPKGVYLPGDMLDHWLQRAYKSSDFAQDSKAFRYVCWTNAKVAAVNKQVRYWLYGETETPFVPGETALIRQQIVRNDTVLFTTNEEAKVEKIVRGTYKHRFDPRENLDGWNVEIPCWDVTLLKDEGAKHTVPMPIDMDQVTEITDRLSSEARVNWERYEDREKFKNSVARLQAIYSQTIHTAQGATHGNTFIDIPDIRRRQRDNLLECKQLLYTALTRPRIAAMLVGV